MTKTEPLNTDIVVSGRTFRPCAVTTFDQDFYVMQKVRDSGISGMPKASNPEELSQAARDIILKAYESGVLFDLVAGILEEKDVPWSKETAILNADFFSRLYDPEDKAALNNALAGVVLSFFMEEGRFSQTSRKSSGGLKQELSPAPPSVVAGKRNKGKAGARSS